MTEEQRLIGLLAENMERLRPLLLRAATVLDQRGSRDLRKRILKDFRFAADITRMLRHYIDEAPHRRCATILSLPRPLDAAPLRLVVNNDGGSDHAA